MRFIVTDLTRFQNPEIICIAGIEPKTTRCVRPMPYLKRDTCKQLKILPGAILDGKLRRPATTEKPHIEDMVYKDLRFHGPCSSEEFRQVLIDTTYNSINDGFNDTLPEESKVIPAENPPDRSIITLNIDPSQLEVVRDGYDSKKIKLHLVDNDGRRYRFLPITDLGFYNLAISKEAEPDYTDNLNSFISSQREVYLRIGLSRIFEHADGRNGFWVQVNGIYTFPEFMTEVRTYKV
jgi:Dual OB-containing domain